MFKIPELSHVLFNDAVSKETAAKFAKLAYNKSDIIANNLNVSVENVIGGSYHVKYLGGYINGKINTEKFSTKNGIKYLSEIDNLIYEPNSSLDELSLNRGVLFSYVSRRLDTRLTVNDVCFLTGFNAFPIQITGNAVLHNFSLNYLFGSKGGNCIAINGFYDPKYGINYTGFNLRVDFNGEVVIEYHHKGKILILEHNEEIFQNVRYIYDLVLKGMFDNTELRNSDNHDQFTNDLYAHLRPLFTSSVHQDVQRLVRFNELFKGI